MGHGAVDPAEEQNISRKQVPEPILQGDNLGAFRIEKPGSHIVRGVSSPGDPQGTAKEAAQIDPPFPGNIGQDMPDKAGTVHPRPAHAVQVVIDIGIFNTPAGYQHIGTVRQSPVGAGLHPGNIEEVPGCGPGSGGNIKDDYLFPPVSKDIDIAPEIIGIKDGTNAIPEGDRIRLTAPKKFPTAVRKFIPLIILGKRHPEIHHLIA
jgi:hypothetical protein